MNTISQLRATYRIQFRPEFPFEAGEKLVPYLKQLGISHLYASPVFESIPGSTHGYDITDYTGIRNELGGEKDFNKLVRALQENGLGLILDFVPNHMAIASFHNKWWRDVLENGRYSRYAEFFDVDWETSREELRNRVLLPVLGDQYGIVLERGEILLEYSSGSFVIKYYDHNLPVRPYSYADILEQAITFYEENPSDKSYDILENIQELKSIARAAHNIPVTDITEEESPGDVSEERMTEMTVIRRRLRQLVEASPHIHRAIQRTLEVFNPPGGSLPEAYDPLHSLLEMQHYRLCYWKVATEEINYRRFFDINHLGAVRMEIPEVFQRTHALLFRLIREGKVQGLRIDHPDGLYDPVGYFQKLREGCRLSMIEGGYPPDDFYIVVEKILEHEERIPSDWQVDGTTGYHFLNSSNRLYTRPKSLDTFRQICASMGQSPDGFDSLVLESSLLVMRRGLSGEIHSLANRLEKISEKSRRSRDFTLPGMVDALQEVIASFPVYRTYSRMKGKLSVRDERYVNMAVNRAIWRNPSVDRSIYEFIRTILMLELPDGMKEESREELREFVMRFQQLTGPIAAKGIEDTAFYNYHLLVSLNEVGGRPDHYSMDVDEFHQRNVERQNRWPLTMNASTTHDTKRSEDVRDRINVLTEMDDVWKNLIHKMEEEYGRPDDDVGFPSAPDRHLLYQTLAGSWPVNFKEGYSDTYRERIQSYMRKAVRETIHLMDQSRPSI